MDAVRAEQLRRQILADPDDRELVAVYADALQAAGDARGEFIALELAGDPAHVGRRITLVTKHARQWWPELPRHRIATRHGLVERIAVLGKELHSVARLFATEPIRDVTLLDGGTVSSVEWPLVRRVAIRGAAWPDLAALIARRGNQLAVLDARACRISPRDVTRLGDALPACRELHVGGNEHLGRALPVLLDWTHLPRLEVLDLARTMLVPDVLAELLVRDLRALRVLRLSLNPFGPLPRPVINALFALPALERLELVDTMLDEDTISVMSRACPRRLRIMFDVMHAPDRIAIDAIGTQLELVRAGPMRWAIDVEGVRRTIRWRSAADEDDALENWTYGEAAAIPRLFSAIACGAACTIDAQRERVVVELGSTLTGAYATSIVVQRRAVIDFAPSSSPISITLYEHVDRD